MTSTAYEPSTATWQWPQDLPGAWADHDHKSAPAESTSRSSSPSSASASDHTSHEHTEQTKPTEPTEQQRRFYRPRTCRICLETVHPTFHPPSENLVGIFQSSPSVTYESEDGGRLLRPCLCKGTQKYVHEACLTAWRLQNPLEKRNYWQCPTCKYQYRLERMTWGRLISSTCE